MLWLNVDKPDRKCTLHEADCRKRLTAETELKGIGELKKDGGWFSFENVEAAKTYSETEWPTYDFVERPGCCRGRR